MFAMRILRALLVGALLAGALALGISAPASASAVCGDTQGGWVPALTASVWDVELYFYDGPVDETAAVTQTYAGQISATVVALPTVQVLTGSWAYDSGTSHFVWSGTDTANNLLRYTYDVTADTCGTLGGVHSASGILIQQDVGQVGVVYATRVT